MAEQSVESLMPSQYPEAAQTGFTAEDTYGPRKMSFFTLVLKSLAGLAGGVSGTLILVIIFLSSSSILQPVLGSTSASETASGEVSPLFMVILMGMIFATSMASSLLGTVLLCYTERSRYNRIATMLSQVFIVNIVIFAFVLPIYLTTSTTRLELTAYAAGLQVILSASASALILELIHDYKYSLLGVYTTILAILVAVGINFFLYFTTQSATLLLFVALPIIWFMVGFSQGALTMLYYWIYETWGVDFLASSTAFGTDYGVPYEEIEDDTPPDRPDVEGSSFLHGG